MTPADIAEKLFKYQTEARARGAYTDCACPSEDEVADAIAEACGAALRERDARWRDAVLKLSDECDMMCWTAGNPDSDCPDAAALRALLEEAGK